MLRKSPRLRKEVLFRNRKDAGEKLAARIANFDLRRPLVLALPRGGIPVAIEIAKALVAPLDLLLVRKLSTSWQPEMAVGAIYGGTNPYTVVNEDIVHTMGITEADVARIAKIQFENLEHRRHLWLGGRQRIPIVGRDAIVVDDGIATGASVRVALEVARRESPARLILACPVVSAETAESLRGLCDDTIFLTTPRHFAGVSEFYRDFRQISDGEVKHLLQLGRG